MIASKEIVPFLDVSIRKENNKIWMELYTKSTDTRRYLPYSSAHPKHCKINIPSCLARRICTIVENEQAKRKHLEELKQTMLQQKYPLNVINRRIDKALAIPQSELRQPKSYYAAGKIYSLSQLTIKIIHLFFQLLKPPLRHYVKTRLLE